MGLSERERIEILMMIGYGDRRRSKVEVCELFNAAHPNRQPITRSTVCKIHLKYEEYGNVKDLPKTGRPKVDDETKLNVLLTVQDNPNCATRQAALNFNCSHETVRKIWHKQKYHPYKVHLVHELSEDDFDRRLEFSENLQILCERDEMFARNILFSDEATFSLNGTVNRQNCRYWAEHNPHWMQEARSQHPQKVNVWAGILKNRILGPFFFDGNLNGDIYLDFLQLELVPALVELYPDPNTPDSPSNEIWFQQDGAPPHYSRPVRDYLNLIFNNRWIGRRGVVEWPARSPDLTPLDFFLWGYLKSKVYVNRPQNINDLKERIRQEIRRITPDVISNVQNEFISRLGYCQIANGQQFEHLLK